MLKNHNSKIFALIISSFLLHGCVRTLDSISMESGTPFTVEIGSLNPDAIVQSVVGDFKYSLKQIPSDRSLGFGVLIVTVMDGNGSSAEISIPIEIVNTRQPLIELIGDSRVTIGIESIWGEPGIRMQDPVNGITTITGESLIINQFVSGKVENGVVGEYVLTYKAKDALGNISNTLTRTIIIRDLQGPVLSFSPSVIVLEGTPISLDDIDVTDNLDSKENIQMNVIWNGLNPTNPTIGEYTVTIEAIDSSNNKTSLNRNYKVIYTLDGLFLVLDNLASRNEITAITTLLTEYQNYSQLDQTRFQQLRRAFVSKHQVTYLTQYNAIKETQSIESAAQFLRRNSIFFDSTFVNDEMFRLVSSNLNRLSEAKKWDEALLAVDQYRGDLLNIHYERFISITLSSMVRDSNSSNASNHRRLLERYATAIGGIESTNYINNSAVISELVFLQFWNQGVIGEAIRSITSDRVNGYISAVSADELVRSETRKKLVEFHRDELTQPELLNFARSINYQYTTIPNGWYVTYIDSLFS